MKEGQLLLELWNKDLLAEEKLASSAVKTAIAQAESARIQAENAAQGLKEASDRDGDLKSRMQFSNRTPLVLSIFYIYFLMSRLREKN